MNDNPLSITPGKTVSDALTTMHEKSVDTLFVVDDYNKLMGRVTIEYIANIDNQSRNITEIMDPATRPLRENSLVQNQLQRVLKSGRSNIPVIDREDKLTGIITKTTLIRILYITSFGINHLHKKKF